LFEQVLPMHKSLHDIIITSSITNVPSAVKENETQEELAKRFPALIQDMLDKGDIIRLQYLIKVKIAIANDLLHLFKFDEALKYDSEALDLLKKVSILSMTMN